MDIVPQLIVNSIIAGAVYTLVALGFNLIFSTVKFFDLGYGALTAVGGYTVFWIYKSLGLPLYVAIPAGMLMAGAIGYLIYRLVYAPLRERKSSGMVLLVGSLGAFTALQAIIAILFTSQFQTLSRSAGADTVYTYRWRGHHPDTAHHAGFWLPDHGRYGTRPQVHDVWQGSEGGGG